MAVFIGNKLANTANAPAGTLIGFVGGTLAQLQDALGDNIVGLAGNDLVVAGDGNDVINGGDGNDFIDGRFGADMMDGGNGIDTMDVSFFAFSYVWNMDTGVTNFSARGEFAFNFENARTGAGADSITGNVANNSILLGAGNDFANGAAGNDTLLGGDGRDILNGSFDNDRLAGGRNNDTLIGGAGFDRFRFDTAPNGTLNFDRIPDFNSASDTIELENAIFAVLSPGALPFDAFLRLDPFHPIGPTHRIIYNPVNGNLFFDPDGSGEAPSVRFAQVNPRTVMDFTDFFVT